jgi:uncharacterized membrane protein YhaH (DUF805 family)
MKNLYIGRLSKKNFIKKIVAAYLTLFLLTIFLLPLYFKLAAEKNYLIPAVIGAIFYIILSTFYVRRLHDIGWSAGIFIIAFIGKGLIVPIFYFMYSVDNGITNESVFRIYNLINNISMLLPLILTLYLVSKDGDKTSNKYGDVPLVITP